MSNAPLNPCTHMFNTTRAAMALLLKRACPMTIAVLFCLLTFAPTLAWTNQPTPPQAPTPPVAPVVPQEHDQKILPTAESEAVQVPSDSSTDEAAAAPILPAVQENDTSDEWFEQLIGTQSQAEAQTESVQAQESTPQQPASPMRSLWTLFFGTAVVALAGWAITFYYKKNQSWEDKPMRHLHTLRLGNRHQISMVEIFGKTLVLGLTDGHVSLLAEIPTSEMPPPSQNPISDSSSTGATQTSRWQEMFQDALQRSRPDSESTSAITPLKRPEFTAQESAASQPRINPTPTSTVHDGLFSSFEPSAPAPQSSASQSRPVAPPSRGGSVVEARSEARSHSAIRHRTGGAVEHPYKTPGNRESDSVLIGLESLKNKGSTG